jgi:putative FmdB family regulatory protein
MPLYEYQCEACAHRFERIQKFSDPPIDTCPTCGGSVRKLISSPAIQFKGSGFYINDYAKKTSGDSGKSSGDGGKPASSSGTSSTTDSSTTTSSTNSSASSSSGGSSTSGSSGSSSSGS